MRLKYILATLLVSSFFAFYVTKANAEETPNPSAIPETTSSPAPRSGGIFGFFKRFEERNETPNPSRSPKAWVLDRLEEKRLKFCQVHEKEIEERHNSLDNLSSRMLSVFDEIAKRVEDFYTNKLVPSGKSLPSYNALVADIASKRAAVQTALNNTQNDISGFSCTADNPKAQITQYRLDMQVVKKALQDYRTSIKNLIVAIRTLVGGSPETSGTPVATASPTPSPTSTPTATP